MVANLRDEYAYPRLHMRLPADESASSGAGNDPSERDGCSDAESDVSLVD